MGFQQQELLTLLTKQCEEYMQIPAYEQQQKRDKRHFINGLMTACRVVGISYEQLDVIVDSMPVQHQYRTLDEQLDVPTYIRNRVQIKL